MTIQQIIDSDDIAQQKALFQFDTTDSDDAVLLKFNLFARFFFNQYFKVKDAPFHKQIDTGNLSIYRARAKSFINLAFRGASKTTRTKLFFAFAIANDTNASRKYIKILSHDTTNCRQFTTDVYNMLIDPRVKQMYPEIFVKSDTKREETMGGFTTSNGIKMISDTVGTSQRGSIQEDSRPDIILFDDFETRETLRSAVKTITIWSNMQEARDGLSYNGGCIYLGNYISEMGNVHKLVQKDDEKKIILKIPIIENGEITWKARYTMEDVDFIKKDSDDFEGEYLCSPSAIKDVYFDREMLDKMPVREPVQTIAGFKLFRKYNPSHRYAGGMDVAGGVGLDSSASVFIDFDTVPAQVVGTYASNTILPEAFGDEIYIQGNNFGGCLVCPENNKYDQTILKARQLGAKLYTGIGKIIQIHTVAPTTFGWRTDSLSKSRMLSSLREAIESGLIELNDRDLINEAKSYTRNELIDNPIDVRLTTRHFDMLTACFVKGTLILTNKGQKPIESICAGDMVMTRNGFRKVKKTLSHFKEVINNIGLTGTHDHPVFCNDNEVKDLQSVGYGDILYIWNSKAQKIERLSYIKALPIIDTQMQKVGHIEPTILEVLSGKFLQNIYIGKFGRIILGTFQRVLLFTIKMATRVTTVLKTLSCFPLVIICNYMGQNQKENNSSETISKRIGIKSIKEYENMLKTKNPTSFYVSCVENLLKVLPTTQCSAQEYVPINIMEKRENYPSKVSHVMCVTKYLRREYHTKKDVLMSVLLYEEKKQNKRGYVSLAEQCLKLVSLGRQPVQNNAVLCEGINDYQQVFNLEVEDTPEYFANNILVHNCAIAYMMKIHARPNRTFATANEVVEPETNPAI